MVIAGRESLPHAACHQGIAGAIDVLAPRILPDQLPGCNDPICAGQSMFLRGHFRGSHDEIAKCVGNSQLSRTLETATSTWRSALTVIFETRCAPLHVAHFRCICAGRSVAKFLLADVLPGHTWWQTIFAAPRPRRPLHSCW